jgi:hypothetical protein
MSHLVPSRDSSDRTSSTHWRARPTPPSGPAGTGWGAVAHREDAVSRRIGGATPPPHHEWHRRRHPAGAASDVPKTTLTIPRSATITDKPDHVTVSVATVCAAPHCPGVRPRNPPLGRPRVLTVQRDRPVPDRPGSVRGEPFDGRAARSQQHSIPPHPARSDHGVRRSTMAIELIGARTTPKPSARYPIPAMPTV